MRILFDQGTPIGIRAVLLSHSVFTAREMGWSELSNGELLAAAEEAGFDVLLTTDTNLPYQQSLANRKLAIVILSKNRWLSIQPQLSQIAAAVLAATPGTVSVVTIQD